MRYKTIMAMMPSSSVPMRQSPLHPCQASMTRHLPVQTIANSSMLVMRNLKMSHHPSCRPRRTLRATSMRSSFMPAMFALNLHQGRHLALMHQSKVPASLLWLRDCSNLIDLGQRNQFQGATHRTNLDLHLCRTYMHLNPPHPRGPPSTAT